MSFKIEKTFYVLECPINCVSCFCFCACGPLCGHPRRNPLDGAGRCGGPLFFVARNLHVLGHMGLLVVCVSSRVVGVHLCTSCVDLFVVSVDCVNLCVSSNVSFVCVIRVCFVRVCFIRV